MRVTPIGFGAKISYEGRVEEKVRQVVTPQLEQAGLADPNDGKTIFIDRETITNMPYLRFTLRDSSKPEELKDQAISASEAGIMGGDTSYISSVKSSLDLLR